MIVMIIAKSSKSWQHALEAIVCGPRVLISEASSRDPFVFSTLRQPRCMEWMALVGLMVTLYAF